MHFWWGAWWLRPRERSDDYETVHCSLFNNTSYRIASNRRILQHNQHLTRSVLFHWEATLSYCSALLVFCDSSALFSCPSSQFHIFLWAIELDRNPETEWGLEGLADPWGVLGRHGIYGHSAGWAVVSFITSWRRSQQEFSTLCLFLVLPIWFVYLWLFPSHTYSTTSLFPSAIPPFLF